MMTETMVQDEMPQAPKPRRRSRLLTAVVAVVLVAAAVSAFFVHRSVTRELLTATEGNAIGAFPGERVDDPFEEREVVKVAYEHGGTYTFEFTINNPTRWNARVSDFPLTPDLGMLKPVTLAIDTTPFDGPDRTFIPFRPFTIHAGEAAMVQVQARFSNCDRFDPGHSSTLVALPVRYRALWARRTHSVDLPTAVQVNSPDNCPE